MTRNDEWAYRTIWVIMVGGSLGMMVMLALLVRGVMG